PPLPSPRPASSCPAAPSRHPPSSNPLLSPAAGAPLPPGGDSRPGGEGTHLSLFMALAKGPYDDLLPWPFLCKVTFYLLDPWRRRPALRETFAPDPCSTSFQQPRGQLNVASGSPLFAPHGQLQNYLKDDTLYVKVVVDTLLTLPIPPSAPLKL
uniref:TRAF1-6 MATH domain-containing protein n=1 Tax=Terrapene triunguis TaxID=2587831 RepID=A0A674JFD1_9SAUR